MIRKLLGGTVSEGWLMAWFSLVYWPVTVVLATRKQYWHDELFTYYISALDTFPRIWSALLTAVDQNPPLFYWLSHKTTQAIGGNLIGLRVPAMIGFWLAGICMIAFVSRHLPAVYGLMAALLLMVSRAYWYSYEARPYGLVLGLAATALVCWQRVEGRGALWWAAGLAAALGLAVSTHYYSVLLFVPIAAAEVYRSWTKRRINWPVWLAMAAAASCLLLYLPLIRSARSYSATFWAKAGIGSLPGFLNFVLSPGLLIAVGAALVWVVFARRRAAGVLENTNQSVFPVTDLVAGFGMLLVVPLAIALGKFVTGAYTPRYALSGVIGLTFLLAWMLATGFRGRAQPAMALAALLSCAFLSRLIPGVGETRGVGGYDHSGVIRVIQRDLPGDLSIAVADPLLFFELSHQAPPEIRRRLFYVADPKIALRRVGTDTLDRAFIDLQPLAPLHVKTLTGAINSNERFLIVGFPAVAYGWLVEELTSRHVPMSVAGLLGNGVVLLAEPGKSD